MSRVISTSDGLPVSESNPLPVKVLGGGSGGKSAYEIAVDNGFDGTEEEWLESLKGKPGDKGDPFTYSDFTEGQLESLKGDPGEPGEPGEAAESQFTSEQVDALLALIEGGE